ncbi:hypothetical protein DPEC_G00178280 [Dallia pectoralis]|uniref:Uncharacterized protein n=1 Tax=Dallia pectoralis TaxID=75939 RepID=A0ACC2GFB9_DALPE|nr:hypothetical protein DPEC_G00178280 [Dallia pectoralis]
MERGEFEGLLLGDRGYPCQATLLTPDPEPGAERNYNVAHCRTRARVEMPIGLLKARFQCLHHLREELPPGIPSDTGLPLFWLSASSSDSVRGGGAGPLPVLRASAFFLLAE